LKVKAVPGKARATVSFKTPSNTGGEKPKVYVVTANDLTSSSRGGEIVQGTSSPIVFSGLMPGDQYTFTVTAANTVGSGPASLPSNQVELPLTPLTIVSTVPSPATTGQKYATTLKATGGFGTLTWQVTGGKLPKGLHLSTSGHISGTVSGKKSTGSYSFTVTVTDLHLPVEDSASATLLLAVS
jgi:hypothetical protein